MIDKFKCILAGLTITIFGCGNTGNNPTTTDHTLLNTQQEQFEKFFHQFRSDSSFQIERVKFPITIESWDMEEDKPLNWVLHTNDWRFLHFDYKEEYANRNIDAYIQDIKIYADSSILEIRGVDNGISIDYVFHPINGKWYLILGRDYSD